MGLVRCSKIAVQSGIQDSGVNGSTSTGHGVLGPHARLLSRRAPLSWVGFLAEARARTPRPKRQGQTLVPVLLKIDTSGRT